MFLKTAGKRAGLNKLFWHIYDLLQEPEKTFQNKDVQVVSAQTLSIPSRSDQETLYRLQHTPEPTAESGAKQFCFSWGNFEYVSIGQLRAQFKEIFIERQYAYHASSPDPVIVDCGGNVGLSAIWFKRMYPTCKLTVFEADPELAAVLKRNLARANYTDVLVRNEAIWVQNGRVAFRKTGDDSGRIDAGGSATLPAIDIAACLPERVDLLKLDIEGAEYAVLNRLCETGTIERVRCLVCEFHVWRERTDDLLEVLKKLKGSGMKLSMTAGAVPWIGLADEEAPFEVIKRNHVLMEVYAWRDFSFK